VFVRDPPAGLPLTAATLMTCQSREQKCLPFQPATGEIRAIESGRSPPEPFLDRPTVEYESPTAVCERLKDRRRVPSVTRGSIRSRARRD
jgi:hypothetical protein